jgi:hypothetical protein
MLLCDAGMDCPRVRYPTLNDEVENDLAEHGYKVLTDASEQVTSLQPSHEPCWWAPSTDLVGGAWQVDKVIQLYEVMMTRHTTMVVGQTGGGKTVILNCLARAQTKMGKKTTLYTINPKVFPCCAQLCMYPCILPKAAQHSMLAVSCPCSPGWLPALSTCTILWPTAVNMPAAVCISSRIRANV